MFSGRITVDSPRARALSVDGFRSFTFDVWALNSFDWRNAGVVIRSVLSADQAAMRAFRQLCRCAPADLDRLRSAIAIRIRTQPAVLRREPGAARNLSILTWR